jgi:sterol desaturase/sphingolipid hydroxylase (fatty acid hydroxylase superfamily)
LRPLRAEALSAVIDLVVMGFVSGGVTALLSKHGYNKLNTAPTSGWVMSLEYLIYFFAFDAYLYWLHRPA